MMNNRKIKLSALLPDERNGFAAPPELQAMREAMANAAAAGKWATEPPMEEVEIAGVRCLRARSPEPQSATVVHFHGGGYRNGSPAAMGPFASALAKRSEVNVVCPQYRLAPDHPFPAALYDAAAVIEALAPQTETLILSGDSAGGGIAASLASLCNQSDVELAGVVLLSPWLDLSVTASTYETNATSDPVFSKESASTAADLYLQGSDPANPLVSPLLASFSGCVPVYLNVGSGEVLLDDARSFHERLVASGVGVQLSVVDGMEHVAVTRGLELVGSQQTLREVAGFIKDCLRN